MGEYTKYYGGKRFAKANTIKTKERAEKAKQALKAKGYNVRLENASGRGYHVYYRKKNWK